MDKLELKALGKINLGLDILGRRENGYHDVRMVMQTVYLYDRVTLEKTREPGIEISTNLSEQGLKDRGVTLGADVPYCIMRGTVLAEGIGEILTPLPPLPKCYVLIAKPPLSASTKTVYEKIDKEGVGSHPDIDGILAGLQKGDLQQVADSMGNVLEQVMLEEYPVLRKIKDVMIGAGALNAMMSGSGPTVFGIFTSRGKAKAAAARLKRQTPVKQAYVTNVHNVRRK